jgi:hypothetical protein
MQISATGNYLHYSGEGYETQVRPLGTIGVLYIFISPETFLMYVIHCLLHPQL